MSEQRLAATSAEGATSPIRAVGTDDEPAVGNQRLLGGWEGWAAYVACILYTAFHLVALNLFPIETWTYRLIHVAGGLGLGFVLMAAFAFDRPTREDLLRPLDRPLALLAAVAVGWPLLCVLWAFLVRWTTGEMRAAPWVFAVWGQPLLLGVLIAIAAGWLRRGTSDRIAWFDGVLAASALAVGGFLVFSLDGAALRMRAGTPLADVQNFYAALVGVLLILELTRRVAGLALVVITAIFIAYAFLGPWLPGFLRHQGYTATRFFTYVYTDNGVLGPTTAVSSTYIILFIVFAAFLQASKVGDYFINFAFACAGRARGGPAKVAVFASALMGMINGTSAGNVVATGSLTIPLMKRVGYRPQSAGAIEAAASTGGQILPPIMGAGAFIMAEVTGIRYTDIAIAAIIPALLYFVAIYYMVDLEAVKLGMKGLPQKELPRFAELVRQVYLFIPVIILIGALFMGYSVIRAGTLAMASAVVVSWLTPHRVGPVRFLRAFELGAVMAIQIIAVCACAGIIVGVIALTGVGARFAALLLAVADTSQLLAMVFAMLIAILLGMGMPTTAAYAVAASVVAPGLVRMGVDPLVAHFFIFYYAVISAITPPVALAAYAGAAIAGSDPMRTSVTAFKFGLAAFIVPFMFFYSPAMLMQGGWAEILHVCATAAIGTYFLACAVQGWFLGRLALAPRFVLAVAALSLIVGGWLTDAIGVGLGAAVFAWQRARGAARADQGVPLTRSG